MSILSEEETKKFKEYADKHPLKAKSPIINLPSLTDKIYVSDIFKQHYKQYSNQKQNNEDKGE